MSNIQKKSLTKEFCVIPDYEVKPSPWYHGLKVKNAITL